MKMKLILTVLAMIAFLVALVLACTAVVVSGTNKNMLFTALGFAVVAAVLNIIQKKINIDE